MGHRMMPFPPFSIAPLPVIGLKGINVTLELAGAHECAAAIADHGKAASGDFLIGFGGAHTCHSHGVAKGNEVVKLVKVNVQGRPRIAVSGMAGRIHVSPTEQSVPSSRKCAIGAVNSQPLITAWRKKMILSCALCH
jgi:hypothetical protein